MGSGGSSQAAKRAVSANIAEADQTEGWSGGTMPTAQEHTSPEVHSKLYDEIMSSIQLVFGHFSDGVRGLPAECLGQAMRILGMNPTEDQVYKHLADLGRPYIDQATFHRFIQDELTKYLEQVQAVVDYLKQYDTDNKGALSTEEVQAAIRGSELSQKKLQASVAKMPSNSKGQLDIVELATCFLELGDEEMLEPSEAEKERASASEADSKAVKIQVVKDDVSADAEATTDEQCRETRAAEESASGPAAYSTMFNDVRASTNAVFRYFSQPSGVPAERLGHAMAILGMKPTEDEVKKHLAGLGGPKYIDQKMFHRFIEEELGKLIPKVQELLDYLKQFDTDGKGALSEEELQEVMRGSELSQDKVQASLRKLPRNSEGHLDIVKLSKYFLELGNSQVEADDSIPGTAKTRQDVASQVREAIAKAADAEARYGLKDPQAFAQFLQDSDVRLVRAKYLVDLVLSKRPLPRRQEAETETFTCDGKPQSALVTHEEVQNWANGTQEAIICSISHAWETREHPDPCRHQLQQIVNHAGLYGAAFKADIWIFYDYSSLFQYERTNPHEERSFRKAMNNMHLMYAHECTLTFRIETLTPEHVWNTMLAEEETVVRVYDAGSKTLKEKPLKLLEANRTPYLLRGWCMAEIEWSSLRGVNAQHQHIDRLKDPKSETEESDDLSGRVPMIPENFRQQMEKAKFTHRSDADAVIYLQQKIFREKVIECQHLVLEGLPAQEISALAHALPHFENLKSLKVRRFRCGEEEATSLVKALASRQVETLEISWGIGESGRFMVKALAEALKTNSSVRDMNFEGNKIGDAGAQALADTLKINSSVRDMNLGVNEIGDAGAQALADALKTNSSVWDMNLEHNEIGDQGAQALAEAFKTNSSVRDMNLEGNGIGPEGAQAVADALQRKTSVRDTTADSELDDGAKESDDQVPGRRPFEAPVRLQGLAEALKTNASVTSIILKWNSIGAEGVKALAEALMTNTSVTRIELFGTSIGDEGVKALAEALKTNTSVTSIILKWNSIGDESAQALAEALMTNTSVTSIDLGENSIGVEGVKALAEALMTNTSVTSIDLGENSIGDEGVKALAEALKTNTSVTSIDLYWNSIGAEGVKALKQVIEEKKKMGFELDIRV